MSDERYTPGYVANCNKCSGPIHFATSWKTGRKYAVNVINGTASRRDFHNCQPLKNQPAQTPVTAAVSAPIVHQAVMTDDAVETFIRDNRADLVLGLNSLLTLDKPVFSPEHQETRVILPNLDGTATSYPVAHLPALPPVAPIEHKRAKPINPAPVQSTGSPYASVSKPVAKSVSKQPLATSSAVGSAVYKCVTETCQAAGQEFPGKLPSQTGNKPIICTTCGNTARFTRRAV